MSVILMNKGLFGCRLGLGAMLIVGVCTGRAELLENGNFDLPGGETRVVSQGSSAIPDWAVVEGKVTYHAVGDFNDSVNPDGGECLELAGDATLGAVTQYFTPEAGKTYTLSFFLAADPAITNGVPALVQVSILGNLLTYESNVPSGDNSDVNWLQVSYSFRPAEGVASVLRLEGLARTDPLQTTLALIDGVSIQEGLPAQLVSQSNPGNSGFNQTGLFTRTIRVTNTQTVTLSAIRLYLEDVPSGVTVYNAIGAVDTVPYVQYNLPLAPLEQVDLVVEFFSASRAPFTEPTYLATGAETYPPVDPTGEQLRINQSVALSGGRYLIGFTSMLGSNYWIQYSDQLGIWKTAVPEVAGNGTQLQWVDNGPPKTDKLPGFVTNRFYRVILQEP